MNRNHDYPMAMPSPDTAVTAITTALVDEVRNHAAESPRKRMIMPFHKEGGDILQRMLNALEPGTYIRPHRHADHRAESIIVLSGAILYFTFSDEGNVLEHVELRAGGEQVGVDTDGGIYHSFVVLEQGTTVFEVKPGPYDAATDKTFAPWAPEEYADKANVYLDELLQYSTTSR